MELIENGRIEVVLVGSDAGLLVRIDTESRHETLGSILNLHERIDIRGVSGWIENDQRRVHVAGGPDGRDQVAQQHGDECQAQGFTL